MDGMFSSSHARRWTDADRLSATRTGSEVRIACEERPLRIPLAARRRSARDLARLRSESVDTNGGPEMAPHTPRSRRPRNSRGPSITFNSRRPALPGRTGYFRPHGQRGGRSGRGCPYSTPGLSTRIWRSGRIEGSISVMSFIASRARICPSHHVPRAVGSAVGDDARRRCATASIVIRRRTASRRRARAAGTTPSAAGFARRDGAGGRRPRESIRVSPSRHRSRGPAGERPRAADDSVKASGLRLEGGEIVTRGRGTDRDTTGEGIPFPCRLVEEREGNGRRHRLQRGGLGPALGVSPRTPGSVCSDGTNEVKPDGHRRRRVQHAI